MSVQHIAHLTIGAHRGAARLWLQGRRLTAVGAMPGRRFGVVPQGPQALLIEIRDDGSRTVSAKEAGRIPVIDVGGRDLEKVFPAGTRVRVIFEANRIRVEVNPRDAAQARRISALKERLASGQPVTTGALCLGAGILDAAVKEGLAAAGVSSQMRFAVEREATYLEHAIQVNPAIRPDTVTVEADLAEVEPAPLGKVDFLIAGIPCTAASRAGRAKHRSMDPTLTHPEGHPEGSLFVDFLRFVIACEPAVVVLENVPPYRHTAAYAAIRATLAKLGYAVTDGILDASEWGCHERRQRLVMVAAPVPIPLDDLAPKVSPTLLAEILEDIPTDDPRWRSHAAHAAKTASAIAGDGRNFKLQLVGHEDTSIGTIGRGYSKDRTTEAHIRHQRDPSRSRLLTVTEHARAKGVPERLVEGLGFTTGHEILGQAIAYPPFVTLGRRIADALRVWAYTHPASATRTWRQLELLAS